MVVGDRAQDNNDDSDLVTSAYYVVAVIDVLGERGRLREIDRLPRDEQETAEFFDKMKSAISPIDRLRESMTTFSQMHRERIAADEFGSPASAAHAALVKRLKSTSELQTQQFSDTVIAYCRVTNEDNDYNVNDIYGVLGACASTMLTMLASKDAIRGGIELGIATDYFPGEIFGPAVVLAHDLESNSAQYPRIVVGNALYRFVCGSTRTFTQDIVGTWQQTVTKMCSELIAIDEDGVPFVDFLGQRVCEVLSAESGDELFWTELHNGLEFATAQQQRFIEEGDQKLALRYALLRQYYETRQRELLNS